MSKPKKPTERTIKREIKRLRAYVDGCRVDDAKTVEARIAYSMECVLRWAVEATSGWDKPLEEALKQARILRDELK